MRGNVRLATDPKLATATAASSSVGKFVRTGRATSDRGLAARRGSTASAFLSMLYSAA
jgi:hypothetical protein